jgi:dipeptidyl aminopeptidase/acylaminoacyl peptidase
MKLRFAAMLAVAASGLSIAHAQTVPPEKAFGARESVSSANLSPDGKTMAFLAPTTGAGNALFTVPVDGSAPPRRSLVASGDPERLVNCNWVSSDRLVCNVYTTRDEAGYKVGLTRQVAVDASGGNVKMVSQRDAQNAWYFNAYGGSVLDWLPGQDGSVLMARWIVPESKAGSLIVKRGEGLAVERVDTRTLQTKTVVAPINNASEYITDGSGNVRIVGVSDKTAEYINTGLVRYKFRPQGSSEWKDLGTYNYLTYDGFNPYAVDPAENVVYGLQKDKGRFALMKRTLDGSNTETNVFAHAEVDVDGPLRLGRKQRIIGVSYATDRRYAHYFDPDMSKLSGSLAKALPGGPIISFDGASDDEQKLLIWAGSDVDPGRHYLLDRTTKQMRPLLLTRPELEGYKLAQVKSVQVKASDGTLVPAYLTLPPGSSGKGLPAIVMPHGGPQSRDEWGFDWLAQYYAHKGYAVLQPNFRGSSGYGEQWFQENGFKSWKIAIGDVTDSGRWLISQGIADPAKLAIVGWSYGGYAALQSGVIAPDLFKAIVAIAPVTDLAELRREYTRTSSQRVMRDWIGSGPHLKEGSPAQNAAAIKAPVMLFHGDVDLNVNVLESRLMEDKLRAVGKTVQMTIYPKLDHGLPDSAVRADMLGKSDAFLRTSMGLN